MYHNLIRGAPRQYYTSLWRCGDCAPVSKRLGSCDAIERMYNEGSTHNTLHLQTTIPARHLNSQPLRFAKGSTF